MGFPHGSNCKESDCNAETWVLPLGWEDPLEEGMVTHSSILAWRIPRTEPDGLQSTGSHRVTTDAVEFVSGSQNNMLSKLEPLVHKSVNT